MQDRPVARTTQSIDGVSEADIYTTKIQPIFNQRCVACHSCLESPCQLNLQSYEGVRRGAIKNNLVYSSRLSEAKPTRLFEDAHSTEDWRNMGFYDVIGKPESSVLLSSVALGFSKRAVPEDEVKTNQYCADDANDFKMVENAESKLAMPYGLPALAPAELQTLSSWVAMGAPGPKATTPQFPPEIKKAKAAWEQFLNKKDMKTKFVARYLYEHLFLADFYLQSQPRYFLKLIRSSTACDKGPKIIATRRPNDDPGVDNWYYCFIKSPGVTVDKTHIPYSLELSKLSWLKKNFMDISWTPDSKLDFSPKVASNPFLAFKSIPEIARYKFLLEDSHYHISTFIKGPVCNGTAAVNSIQEQFYAFFIDPNSDLMVLNSEYAAQVSEQLELPGKWGSNVDISGVLGDYQELIDSRNNYRMKRSEKLKLLRPNGLTLKDIWNGDGRNENAVLTIIRHNDSARVMKGAVGDLSKTVFVVDYSLLERLSYNLVINFDVYGSIGHQFLTRVYMDLIRMEAENNFLDFLPREDRLKIKKSWYRGFITSQNQNIFDEHQFPAIPAGMNFEKDGDSQRSLVRRILFDHLNEKVRGPIDPINWKRLQTVVNQTQEEKTLSRLASTEGKFVRFFPEVAFLIVKENNVPKRTYTIVRNRQLKNVSWIMLESTRADPKHETLMVIKGYQSSYPNQILAIEASDLPKMVDDVLKIFDQSDYNNSVFRNYGLLRMDPRIWTYYDFMVQDYVSIDPVGGGYFDLSRLQLY